MYRSHWSHGANAANETNAARRCRNAWSTGHYFIKSPERLRLDLVRSSRARDLTVEARSTLTHQRDRRAL